MSFQSINDLYNRFRQWLKVDLKLSRKGLILVFVPLSFVLIIMLCLAILLVETEFDLWRESESKMIITRANAVSRDFLNGSRLLTPSALSQLQIDVAEEITNLKKSFIDNPVQMNNLIGLERISSETLAILQKASLANKEQFTEQINKELNAINIQVAKIEEKEQQELNASILRSSSTRSTVLNGLLLGVALNIVLALIMARYFSKGINARLATVFENSKRLAKGQPLLPEQPGHDEIARLDLVFHKMAEKVAEMAHKEKALIENAVDVIFTIDSSGQFSMINSACLKAWGYAPEELIGQRITKVLYKTDRALAVVLINKLIKGAASRTFEARLVRKDGTIIDILWSATWSKIEKSLFCVAHDITQRKEVERLKQDFYTMISHDLRTPLTSILFSLNIALKRLENLSSQISGENTNELSDELQAAERNCANLLKLIDNLLDVEKMEAGQIVLIPKVFSLSSLVAKAEESVSAYARQKQIKLICQFEQANITADEERLLQVLINLLGNAIKFSSTGDSVKLSAAVADDYFSCQVEDQGPGIPEQFQDTIFERFKQINTPGTTNKSGTGLGLTISRAIIKAHDGEIGVRSIEGQGSTFWFKIPLSRLNELT